MNCDEDTESLIESEDQSQEGSQVHSRDFSFFFNLYINCNLFLQDAVQTLINAVQELIQTHEATEHSEKKEKQDC